MRIGVFPSLDCFVSDFELAVFQKRVLIALTPIVLPQTLGFPPMARLVWCALLFFGISVALPSLLAVYIAHVRFEDWEKASSSLLVLCRAVICHPCFTLS